MYNSEIGRDNTRTCYGSGTVDSTVTDLGGAAGRRVRQPHSVPDLLRVLEEPSRTPALPPVAVSPRALKLGNSVDWTWYPFETCCEPQNNDHTKHLAKLLVHLVWCLQDAMSASDGSTSAYKKAINASYIASVFLKFMIENTRNYTWEELCLDIDRTENGLENFPKAFCDTGGASLPWHSGHSLFLHHELLNFMIVAMSTQLCSGPSPEPKDMHPFLDAAMLQESDIVTSVVRRLLLNFITRPHVPFNGSSYPIFSDNGEPGVLQRVGSAANIKCRKWLICKLLRQTMHKGKIR
ncbi:Dyggve-Melchior-Clausen syndrome protein [Carex littledalei]|uniref:Dymeclin n=1 Tax=Carex littledalei TaxID=544730 RepID=A0A833R2V5_9POAL|nr:Dyggve-Melchior-Clausen syndrome protein [Carex littledalei]